MKNKTIVLGLVGSGKTTLYRKLNEENTATAVEIELPQACIENDAIKETLLKLYLEDKDIDTIITHPYFLCKDFIRIVDNSGVSVKYEILEIDFEKRFKRVRNRSSNLNINCQIFPIDFLLKEEKNLKNLKNLIKFSSNLLNSSI